MTPGSPYTKEDSSVLMARFSLISLMTGGPVGRYSLRLTLGDIPSHSSVGFRMDVCCEVHLSRGVPSSYPPTSLQISYRSVVVVPDPLALSRAKQPLVEEDDRVGGYM